MESWMPFFVVVIAIAVVLQAIVLINVLLQVRRTAQRIEQVVTDLHTRATPMLSRLEILVEDLTPRIAGIVNDASELTRLARSQAIKMDRVISEMMERLRLQLIHVDHILTGALETVEVAGSQLRQTIWGPVQKATALVRGIQTGLEYFRSARRNGPVKQRSEQPPQDEGMFI
jgi:hypothetical protein